MVVGLVLPDDADGAVPDDPEEEPVDPEEEPVEPEEEEPDDVEPDDEEPEPEEPEPEDGSDEDEVEVEPEVLVGTAAPECGVVSVATRTPSPMEAAAADAPIMAVPRRTRSVARSRTSARARLAEFVWVERPME